MAPPSLPGEQGILQQTLSSPLWSSSLGLRGRGQGPVAFLPISFLQGASMNTGCFEDRHFPPLLPFFVSSALKLRPCASLTRAGADPAHVFHMILSYFTGWRGWATVLISSSSHRRDFHLLPSTLRALSLLPPCPPPLPA